MVNDGTFFEPVQVVYSDVLENFEEVEKLNVGAAIIVTGKLVATPGTKQPFEIQAEKVEVEGPGRRDLHRGRFHTGLSAAEETSQP